MLFVSLRGAEWCYSIIPPRVISTKLYSQGRVRKRHARMFYLCLTHGALIREKDKYPSRGVFERRPKQASYPAWFSHRVFCASILFGTEDRYKCNLQNWVEYGKHSRCQPFKSRGTNSTLSPALTTRCTCERKLVTTLVEWPGKAHLSHGFRFVRGLIKGRAHC